MERENGKVTITISNWQATMSEACYANLQKFVVRGDYINGFGWLLSSNKKQPLITAASIESLLNQAAQVAVSESLDFHTQPGYLVLKQDKGGKKARLEFGPTSPNVPRLASTAHIHVRFRTL